MDRDRIYYENRISLLISRKDKDNSNIIRKLQRQLRKITY